MPEIMFRPLSDPATSVTLSCLCPVFLLCQFHSKVNLRRMVNRYFFFTYLRSWVCWSTNVGQTINQALYNATLCRTLGIRQISLAVPVTPRVIKDQVPTAWTWRLETEAPKWSCIPYTRNQRLVGLAGFKLLIPLLAFRRVGATSRHLIYLTTRSLCVRIISRNDH